MSKEAAVVWFNKRHSSRRILNSLNLFVHLFLIKIIIKLNFSF